MDDWELIDLFIVAVIGIVVMIFEAYVWHPI
jgi:hypothetical protein